MNGQIKTGRRELVFSLCYRGETKHGIYGLLGATGSLLKIESAFASLVSTSVKKLFTLRTRQRQQIHSE